MENGSRQTIEEVRDNVRALMNFREEYPYRIEIYPDRMGGSFAVRCLYSITNRPDRPKMIDLIVYDDGLIEDVSFDVWPPLVCRK